jgi:hypothetical protein
VCLGALQRNGERFEDGAVLDLQSAGSSDRRKSDRKTQGDSDRMAAGSRHRRKIQEVKFTINFVKPLHGEKDQ